MTASDVVIHSLRNEYYAGIKWGENYLSDSSEVVTVNNGFYGSLNVVHLSSGDKMFHDAPGCIASRLATLVAKNGISIGMAGQGAQPHPFRFYTPIQLSITTQHLIIGDIKFLVEPQHGFISCRKLTLIKSKEDDPSHFELVKSWVMNDDVEIETIRKREDPIPPHIRARFQFLSPPSEMFGVSKAENSSRLLENLQICPQKDEKDSDSEDDMPPKPGRE